MKKNLLIGLTFALLIIFGIILIANQPDEDENTLKIGVLSILSGDGAAWGENAKRGIDLAVKEANKNGIRGKKIELVYEDTKADPKQALSAYRKLTSINRVDAILGPLYQIEVSALAPIISQEDFPVVAPSYAPLGQRPDPQDPLLIWMDAPEEAKRIAEYVLSQNAKKIGIVATQDPWESEIAKTFNTAFTNVDGVTASLEIIPIDASEIRSTATKLLSSKPDAILIATYYQFIPLIQSLKELGYRGKLFGIEVDSYLVDETKPLSNGVQFIAPDYYSNEFVETFEKEYGQKPGIPTGQAYDAANILLSFFETYNTKEEILRAMREFKEYDGVSGRITITDDNRTLLPTAIFEIQNGKIVKISP